MKKIISLVMATLLLVGLFVTGCATTGTPAPSASPNTTPKTAVGEVSLAGSYYLTVKLYDPKKTVDDYSKLTKDQLVDREENRTVYFNDKTTFHAYVDGQKTDITKKDIAKGDFVAIEVLNGEILSVAVIIKAQANN